MQYFVRNVPLLLLMLASLAATAGAGDREVHELEFAGDQGGRC